MGGESFLETIDTLLIFKLSATLFALLLYIALRWFWGRSIPRYAARHGFSGSRLASTRRALDIMGILALVGVLAIVWSIQFQSFMLASGAVLATIGVGFFAGWSILSNVTAGIIMFWRFPMHVGDKIGLVGNDKFVARIKEFRIFYIILEDEDGNLVTLPNSQTMQQMFIVFTGDNPRKEEPAPEEAGSRKDPNSDAD